MLLWFQQEIRLTKHSLSEDSRELSMKEKRSRNNAKPATMQNLQQCKADGFCAYTDD